MLPHAAGLFTGAAVPAIVEGIPTIDPSQSAPARGVMPGMALQVGLDLSNLCSYA